MWSRKSPIIRIQRGSVSLTLAPSNEPAAAGCVPFPDDHVDVVLLGIIENFIEVVHGRAVPVVYWIPVPVKTRDVKLRQQHDPHHLGFCVVQALIAPVPSGNGEAVGSSGIGLPDSMPKPKKLASSRVSGVRRDRRSQGSAGRAKAKHALAIRRWQFSGLSWAIPEKSRSKYPLKVLTDRAYCSAGFLDLAPSN